ncbi:MAG: hypothetical protein GW854_00505 [Erythrobacter sp.]|nr:hypothetical protein [Erythrobacter sp.]
MYASWNAPLGDRGHSQELVLSFEKGRLSRLLILPPLFDEHNKLRRQIVAVMRRLDGAGIDSVLPDLPGCNESPAPLEKQSLADWRAAVREAANHFEATHILAIRGGGLLAPDHLPGFLYAPSKGRQILRALLRARTIASREAGRAEKVESLLETGREQGLELAGWHLSAEMIAQLEQADAPADPRLRIVDQATLGGSPLWLRAEPSEDPDQADALAAIIAMELVS